jgi:tripartite-type tricarboxylate transporter receptor subunit TctC
MKRITVAVTTLVVTVLGATGVFAQEFPAKPITLIVTYPPGGGADLMARLIGPKMSEALGQPIVVENKGGAAGQLGANFVANAKPDGYTVMVDAASFVINQALYPQLPYDAEKAFIPVGILAAFPHVIVVTPNYDAKSVLDLVAAAKASPNSISYASSGTGSAQHLAGAAFTRQTTTEMVHIPYKGGGPAMNDVMGGHIPLFFANVASSLSHIKGGRLRALAVADGKRIAALPDVPAMTELGLSGGVVYEWNGLFVPAGTPNNIVAKLADALTTALQNPELKQRITDLGGEVIGGGRDGAANFITEQRAVTGMIIRDGKITPD